jgi:hypothetical protein
MRALFRNLEEAVTWAVSFLIVHDLSRLDRRMRYLGIAVMLAVIAALAFWDRP